jgi:hypothetical protein
MVAESTWVNRAIDLAPAAGGTSPGSTEEIVV